MKLSTMKKVIIICSGGMDSVTMLHDLNQCYSVVGVVSFNYGQKHKLELAKARLNATKLGLEHIVVNLSNIKPLLASSSLIDNVAVPEGHYEAENMKSTVVPNRNMIMISIATAYAISKGANYIAYGAHSGDHYIYPDCRPEFIEKLNEVIKICDFNPIELLAPYSDLTKEDILRIGIPLGVDYKETLTCYNGRKIACGRCGSCQERLEAFAKVGQVDPLDYVTRKIIAK